MLIPALASLTWIAYLFAGAVLLAFFALLVYKAVSALRGKKTGCCCGSKGKKLVKDFHSEVPDTLEQLVKLPGVGRKTANVIQSVVFNKAAMAVDTHVFRVSHRIGLVPKSCTTPLATEKYLMKYLPEAVVPTAHHWLILHGRYVCTARNPKCAQCGLNGLCKESLKAVPEK